ncbi:hypothetical protein [Cryptosporangium minutisporangium]|uniref:Uncharacterized protein n=1 Tax=Cryptosporangium minutisporangium TaxID=113569 RepID=A0ABP6SWG2_9ACTN
MASTEESPVPRRAGRWLLRIGAACFVVGVVFVGIVFLPFFAGSSAQPALAAVGTMLGPLGFVLVLLGIGRQAAENNRAARAALQRD